MWEIPQDTDISTCPVDYYEKLSANQRTGAILKGNIDLI